MYGTLGFVLILAAFVASLVATGGFVQATREALGARPLGLDAYRTARWAWGVMTAALVAATAILIGLIVAHRFEYAYVYQYSSRALPLHYLVSTFWAGQEGSFLIWILFTAFLGFAMLRWTPASWRAPSLAVVAGCEVFLISMVVGVKLGAFHLGSSPFDTLAARFPDAPVIQTPGFVPPDGNGLNDLLQNPWMVIHPPTLFIGFATMLAPFALAVAALWTRRYTEWVRPALPWMLMGVLILGVGITLGGYWAYVTLSFGGYWAWDPVENSSLVPWLVGVAALHAMLVQKRIAAGHKSALALTVAAFLLVVYSTFLTRSGILGDISVHSFVDLGLYGQLVVWIGAMALVGFGLLALRWRELPRPDREAPYLSREFLIFSGAVALTALAAVIIVGTSAPIFGRIFRDNPSGVPVSFYNAWSLPLTVAVLFLAGLGQLFWWHRMALDQVNRVVFRPLVLAVASTLLILFTTPFVQRTVAPPAPRAPLAEAALLGGLDAFWGQYGTGLLMLLVVLMAFFTLYGNAWVAWRVGRGNAKMMGGGLAHVGLALTVLGIVASSGFSTPLARGAGVEMPSVGGTSRDNFVLSKGETRPLGGYRVTYAGREKTAEGYDRYLVRFAHAGGRDFTLRPVVYKSPKEQWIQHPDVQSFVEKDLYAAVTPAAMFDSPRADSAAGGTLDLQRGQSTTLGNSEYRLAFEAFETAIPPGALDGVDTTTLQVAVTARLALTNLATNETRTLHPVYLVHDDGTQSYVQTRVPDWGLAVAFGGMNVSTNSATLVVQGVSVTPEDWIVVQAYEKPFIGLVWAGILLLSLGTLVAFVRRIREVSGRGTLATT